MASYTKAYCLSQHCYGQALVMVSDVAARRRSVPICFAPRPLIFAVVFPIRSAPSFSFFLMDNICACVLYRTSLGCTPARCALGGARRRNSESARVHLTGHPSCVLHLLACLGGARRRKSKRAGTRGVSEQHLTTSGGSSLAPDMWSLPSCCLCSCLPPCLPSVHF